MVRVDDLVPFTSGQANLGIDAQGASAFDITSLSPFNHVHQISGIFHDPWLGQSGVIRFSHAAGAFEVSVDGGLTFAALGAGAGVDSIGVIGDTNLTGNVDLASVASGFMALEDSAGASPILLAVDTLGLSGLWGFPTQGFNGRVVNALTDSNSTESQGVVSVVGASGLLVDIVGQIMTISPAQNALARCVGETFSSQISVTVTHGFNTVNVITQVRDSNDAVIIPDDIIVDDANNVTVSFNSSRSGRIVVFGC